MMKKFLTGCLLLAVLVLAAGCQAELTPYEQNDASGYRVSVKFDAGEGIFTTNTSVIVDAYDLSQVKTDGSGMAQIPLIAPDHEARGNDAFAAVKNGCFLAGWYQERTETADGYVYAGRWDFETDRLAVDPQGSYSSAEPVMTLYAAWVPLFQVDFQDRATGETLGSYAFDPAGEARLQVPQWDPETGVLEMHKFPRREGHTFEAAYYDAQGTQPVTTEALVHPGTVDYATGTARDNVLTVFLDWAEGEWYHIYNVEQFLENANVAGSYVLHADLDFADAIWPTALMYGNFTGTIEGNGHTISNVSVTQTNNAKSTAGLFGRLAETAELRDLKLENVTFTIQSGTRVAGTSYGLLAGAIADTARVENLTIRGGQLVIDARAYFGTEDYVIGLLTGMGRADVDHDITCTVSGGEEAGLYAQADGEGFVTLTDAPAQTLPEETPEENS